MNGIGTKQIETKRLILRKIKLDDTNDIYSNWTSDPLVSKYVTWDKHESIIATHKYVKYKVNRYEGNDFCFDWIIVLKETNQPIGEIEAVKVSKANRLIEVGYCIGSKFWNQGFAAEALEAFIKYMFKEVKVDKVVSCHISTNPQSGRVMSKAKMKYDATLKGYIVDKSTNKREDMIYYSIDNDIIF